MNIDTLDVKESLLWRWHFKMSFSERENIKIIFVKLCRSFLLILLISVNFFNNTFAMEKEPAEMFFDEVKFSKRFETYHIGEDGKISRISAAYFSILKLYNSKDIIFSFLDEESSNSAKLYALIWLFENDKNIFYDKIKKIDLETTVDLLIFDEELTVTMREAIKMIINGELKEWLYWKKI